MVKTLSPEDRAFIEGLKKADVLQDIDKDLLDLSNGIILVTCADGDRFFDIFQHQVRIQSKHRPDLEPRIHPLSWHGGTLACAPHSPINKFDGDDEVFRRQISAAPGITGIKIIGLLAHATCGAAGLAGVSVKRSIELYMRARKEIKLENPGIEVVSMFHVDYGDVKRTHFLSRENWQDHHREVRIAGYSAHSS